MPMRTLQHAENRAVVSIVSIPTTIYIYIYISKASQTTNDIEDIGNRDVDRCNNIHLEISVCCESVLISCSYAAPGANASNREQIQQH